ncbi:MAG: Hsp20/alpha crystallin family protein [Pirellulales bacterium]|nr:Hsp20/alpha crystallin family protein [Planctomycetales bacterium]
MFRSLVPHREGVRGPLARFEREVEDLWNRFYGPTGEWMGGVEGFTPRSNVVETGDALQVTMDLPGMKVENVEVEVKDGALWITGHREEEQKEETDTYHRRERFEGRFRRIEPLPITVDEEHVTANYADGVLTVTLPKKEEAKAKTVKIEQA